MLFTHSQPPRKCGRIGTVVCEKHELHVGSFGGVSPSPAGAGGHSDHPGRYPSPIHRTPSPSLEHLWSLVTRLPAKSDPHP
jgi:hypothetical protein